LSYNDYWREKKLIKADVPWTDFPLNNAHIDETMEKFAIMFPDFHAYPFVMDGFMGRPDVQLNSLPPAHLYQQGKRRWGVVINTDTYSGPGKHWTCMYGDMSSSSIWTIEYFNSSSNPPFPDVAAWIKRTEHELIELISTLRLDPPPFIRVITNPNDYQRGEGHHCGVYSLVYIWQRLNGVDPDKYLRKKISNAHVLAFRRYMFNEPK
jgi:hypothetical protein